MKVDLLKGNLNRTFFLLFFSALGSTIIQTIYSAVDMICVGQYAGAIGSSAIGFINPMWAMMFAPGVLAGVGGSVMAANRKGAGNERSANEYFTIATTLAFAFAMLIMLSFIIFPRELLIFFGADDPEALELAISYMKSVAIISPTFTLCACLATFMRNDGEAVIPTVATIAGGIVNMILDVLLVFDFGFGLGVAGAGIATSIGQFVAFAIIFSYFFTKKCQLRIVRPHRTFAKLMRILSLGISAFAIEVAFGVTSTVFNNIIMENLSTNHHAVYTTAATVTIMFYCLLNAAGTAMQPIASQNFGSKNLTRVLASLKIALITAFVVGVICFLSVEIMPATVLKIYMSVDDEILEIGPGIMRTYMLSIPLVGISLVASFYFQSILKQWMSFLIAILRGIILPLTFLFTLPEIFGIDSIWWCIPLSEGITFLVAVLFILISNRGLRKSYDHLLSEVSV
ncbi:MAG: polysaccharide biosynthesis C-terminal domain-containing protein [Clostridia bacterium]|nr:polysaccharide biosynthesis C-terminal domain-containing protein [Clostridia bacterium]